MSEREKLPFDTWEYKGQTKMKHKIFEEYFDKWVKILGSRYKLNYFDCFAGGGAYHEEGEIYYGSPILATKAIQKNNKDATIVVIDKEKKVLDNLEKVFKYQNLSHMNIIYINEDYDKIINDLLDDEINLNPTFFFIDPFGYSIKYSTLKRIMSIEKSEILLNFMYDSINRWLSVDSQTINMSNLFGTEDWKKLVSLEGRDRESAIIDLFWDQLKKIAKYVFPFPFEEPDKRRTKYYIIHLTNHLKGCTIMKSCFAKHNQGRLSYLGNRSPQMRLSDFGDVKSIEVEKYLFSKYNNTNQKYLDILESNIDNTPYLESDFLKSIKNLEEKGKVYIERKPKFTKTLKLTTAIDYQSSIYFDCLPSITRKTMLYETKVEYGNFSMNPFLGCSHGCKYPCYALNLNKRTGRVKSYDEWVYPKIVQNTLELLEKEIPKYKKEINFVHLCFSTDPFMYNPIYKRNYPKFRQFMLNIIKKLNRNGIRCTILTKGLLPEELADRSNYHEENEYGITLVSLDKKFKQQYEPYSAPFEDRISALKNLSEAGFKTWVSIEPYPTPNIVQQDLSKILEKISFVDKIIFGKLNYNKSSNNFENKNNFYEQCVESVIDFCNKNKIKLHIKRGTSNSNKETNNIFDFKKK